MATSLGGVALAAPAAGNEGVELEAIDQGALHILADGSLAYDYVNTRYRITVRWKGITAAERATIRTRYEVKAAQAWVSPNADNFTVFVVPNSWRESWIEDGGGTARYDCELRLEESTA
jgi:hypothetical protein